MFTNKTLNWIPLERRLPSLLTLFFVLIFLLLLWWQGAYYTAYPYDLPDFKDNGTAESKKLALKLLISRSDLLASWALAIIASLGAIVNFFKPDKGFGLVTTCMAFVVFICAMVSAFYSHIVSARAIQTLNLGKSPLDDDILFDAAMNQYLFLTISVGVFVGVVFFMAATPRQASDSDKKTK